MQNLYCNGGHTGLAICTILNVQSTHKHAFHHTRNILWIQIRRILKYCNIAFNVKFVRRWWLPWIFNPQKINNSYWIIEKSFIYILESIKFLISEINYFYIFPNGLILELSLSKVAILEFQLIQKKYTFCKSNVICITSGDLPV